MTRFWGGFYFTGHALRLVFDILINKISIDGKNYLKFVDNIEAQEISLELQFIAIPSEIALELYPTPFLNQ